MYPQSMFFVAEKDHSILYRRVNVITRDVAFVEIFLL